MLNGVLQVLPVSTREDLLDLGFANVSLGVSYLLLDLGLALAGYQLWRGQALASISPERRGEAAAYATDATDALG